MAWDKETTEMTKMVGDQTLFHCADVVETALSVIEPIQDVWQALPARFPNYAASTWGPTGAHDLIARDGRQLEGK